MSYAPKITEAAKTLTKLCTEFAGSKIIHASVTLEKVLDASGEPERDALGNPKPDLVHVTFEQYYTPRKTEQNTQLFAMLEKALQSNGFEPVIQDKSPTKDLKSITMVLPNTLESIEKLRAASIQVAVEHTLAQTKKICDDIDTGFIHLGPEGAAAARNKLAPKLKMLLNDHGLAGSGFSKGFSY